MGPLITQPWPAGNVRILIVCPDGNPVGGVRQHCLRLAEQLIRQGAAARVVDPYAALDSGKVDIVHLHYVPFAFGMNGLAVLPLIRQLQRIGRLVVTFHEARTEFRLAPREAILAPLQAIPLAGLKAAAKEMIIPTKRWTKFFPSAKVTFIAAGSSLPPEIKPATPEGGGDPLRVGMIYSGHPGRAADLAAEACVVLAHEVGAVPLCIGGSVAGMESTARLDILAFGAALKACDMLVLPYADGVSGRRTSFISAMQVAVPVVTTTLLGEDDFESSSAFASADARSPRDFVELCLAIASDRERRTQLAEHAQTFFSDRLSWSVLGANHAAVYDRAAA
jgi:glycosyltransferase involved in cell wall biosynthesis